VSGLCEGYRHLDGFQITNCLLVCLRWRWPRLPNPTPPHFDLLRTACAPTSTHSNRFCATWVCISSSSSSRGARAHAPHHPLKILHLRQRGWFKQQRGQAHQQNQSTSPCEPQGSNLKKVTPVPEGGQCAGGGSKSSQVTTPHSHRAPQTYMACSRE
jgi:hypothetical protein